MTWTFTAKSWQTESILAGRVYARSIDRDSLRFEHQAETQEGRVAI
jgi:hypothetical protein